jgi:hypothetical protein
MSNWIFLEKRPDRSATGDAFRNSFEGEDVVTALARESIQNADDEVEPGKTLLVRFTKKEGVDLSRIWCSDFLTHARATKLLQNVDPRMASALYVEDFGTKGLTGSMIDMDSNMYKLMGQLGGSGKVGGEGGSFGYGKAASILNSGSWTVIAYTITDRGSSLFGTAYLDSHKLLNPMTGLGWFCANASDSNPLEFVDDEADQIAKQLGIPRSFSGEKGTSLLIPAPSIDMSELKSAIEINWWTRLVDHTISIELLDGDKRIVPSPTSNPALKNQIQLYEIIQQRSRPLNGDVVKNISAGNRQLGSVAMRFLEEVESTTEDAINLSGSIALMRKSRMIVDYYRWQQGPRADFVGVFVAHDQINEDLQRTESHRHDVWSTKATRATPEQRELAKTLLERIRKEYRNFLKAYLPPPSQDEVTLQELRRDFGQLFSLKGTTGGGAKAETIAIQRKQVQVRQIGSDLQLYGGATIKWNGKRKAVLECGVKVVLAESDVSSSGDELDTTVTYKCAAAQPAGSTHFLLSPGETVEVAFESEQYDSEWTATATFFALEVKDEN